MASPHSDWLLDPVTPAGLRKHLPAVYEAMLAPIYWLYRLVGPATAEWLAHGVGLAEAAEASSFGAGYAAVVGGMLAPLVGAAAVLATSSMGASRPAA